jgi:curved DNA-binding protein CbpA
MVIDIMNNKMTLREACFYLGVGENASDEQIKRAYRYKLKLYHPDANPEGDTYEYFLKIQDAYEVLMEFRNRPPMPATPRYYTPTPPVYSRQAKVFSSTPSTKASYRRQKEKEKEVEKLNKWDKEYRTNKTNGQTNPKQSPKTHTSPKSKEEEALEKIRAIWLAETIKRQIEADKEHKEAMQRRKLYQAFMQQKLNDDDTK